MLVMEKKGGSRGLDKGVAYIERGERFVGLWGD